MTGSAGALVIVVMGVSGTGKSSVAALLAAGLGVDLVEGDAFHPASNIDKMSAGVALTDDDRWPWLEVLAALAREERAADRSVVLTCSALKRSYRDVLRSGVEEGQVFFVHLHAVAEVLAERMARRTEHFMPAALLASQLATLEPLEDDERGVTVDVVGPLADVAAAARLEVERARTGS
ncbi:gluconokinase [Nocardioides sp.]|uniref:gluconokinase n=1 Tax=Nocardioides sp. TaxID=35761 RepID=UPI002B270377|nr:gluconokinase [Nocardioides sp.]